MTEFRSSGSIWRGAADDRHVGVRRETRGENADVEVRPVPRGPGPTWAEYDMAKGAEEVEA